MADEAITFVWQPGIKQEAGSFAIVSKGIYLKRCLQYYQQTLLTETA